MFLMGLFKFQQIRVNNNLISYDHWFDLYNKAKMSIAAN